MWRRHFSGVSRFLNEAIDPYSSLPSNSASFGGTEHQAAARHHDIEYTTGPKHRLGFQDALVKLGDYFYGDHNHTLNVFGRRYQEKRTRERQFVDLRLLRLVSGKGGNGSVSFFRDANRPVGPPDGGDGGNGGNIYIKAVEGMGSLHRLRRSYVAGPGSPGTGSQLDGKNGDDVIIEVPVGTSVRWIPDPLEVRKEVISSGLSVGDLSVGCKLNEDKNIQFFRDDYKPGEGWMFKERDEEYHQERDYFVNLNKQVKDYDREVIGEELAFDHFPLQGYDFDKSSEAVLVLRGGKGGMGNMHFLTGDVRNPRFSKRGRKGLCEFFLLELKLIADLGLVGLPNAGKLTLLRAVSRARPRVGHWKFTTLHPTVGTISPSISLEPFTVADIPGVIAGASENKGMGLDFLRHVERSGGLVFVIALDLKNPIADLQTLLHEVGEKRMRGKRVMIVATKADLTENKERYDELVGYITTVDPLWMYVPVCAPRGENVDKLIKMMATMAGNR